MSSSRAVAALTILLVTMLLTQCGTERKEVVLRLKFNPNQRLEWAAENKKHIEVYENDSMTVVENNQYDSRSVEEVLKIIDSATAHLKLTSFYDKKIPDKKDTTKFVTVTDSMMIEYIQNNRAVNLNIMPYDTTSLERLEYTKRLYEQIAPRYPDEPVYKGYSWTNSIKVLLLGGETNDAVTTYTVKDFVRDAGYDCVVIEFKGNTIVPLRTEYEASDGSGTVTETRIDKRESEGTAYIAYKEGFIVRESYSFKFLGEGTRAKNGKEVKLKIVADGSDAYHLIKAEGI